MTQDMVPIKTGEITDIKVEVEEVATKVVAVVATKLEVGINLEEDNQVITIRIMVDGETEVAREEGAIVVVVTKVAAGVIDGTTIEIGMVKRISVETIGAGEVEEALMAEVTVVEEVAMVVETKVKTLSLTTEVQTLDHELQDHQEVTHQPLDRPRLKESQVDQVVSFTLATSDSRLTSKS
jgi:hypothetical protein